MKNKFETLLNILDKIIEEAPDSYKKLYSVDDLTKKEKSRSRAYIHLFLMSKFGLLDFEEREKFIVDGIYDGGIDAYFIDQESYKIFIIQSKFRNNERNFTTKKIEIEELLKMDVNRVLSGESFCEKGNKYNGKIRDFQERLSKIKNLGRYDYKVIILANCNYDEVALKRLTGSYECTVYDHERSYDELVYPVVCGNYYSNGDLEVNISLENAQHPRIQYIASVGNVDANITVLFVPTLEIAKLMSKYKNSILTYNPRSYLEMRKNSVNSDIEKSIKESNNNEFSLYNNGITVVCNESYFTEKNGKKNKASLSVKMPQIINGGQTAFTLSKIYESVLDKPDKIDEYFLGKEVLVKVIWFEDSEDSSDEDDEKSVSDFHKYLNIVEKVSQATNRQNPIDDADRKANEQYQVDFQKYIYKKSGLYYERKRGEFGDGIARGYISKNDLIKRDDLVRSCFAANLRPGLARSASKKVLFGDDLGVEKILTDKDSYNKYLLAIKIFLYLKNYESKNRNSNDKYLINKFGNAFRYGRYAVISSVFSKFSMIEIESKLDNCIDNVLSLWLKFENTVKDKYSNTLFKNDNNMLNYYKGNHVKEDIKSYFKNV